MTKLAKERSAEILVENKGTEFFNQGF